MKTRRRKPDGLHKLPDCIIWNKYRAALVLLVIGLQVQEDTARGVHERARQSALGAENKRRDGIRSREPHGALHHDARQVARKVNTRSRFACCGDTSRAGESRSACTSAQRARTRLPRARRRCRPAACSEAGRTRWCRTGTRHARRTRGPRAAHRGRTASPRYGRPARTAPASPLALCCHAPWRRSAECRERAAK